ncbi:MAG TPA: hypothetical protein VNH18_30655 [Bryobacteraceae bacterium]|nr:hypothetical protein [Bryobacteraceae bacterium]HXJ43684.1 hypothetical protein [Bryobacteraceae bacterium]
MKAVSELRFNTLAGYSRSSTKALVARDLAWYEDANEKVLGLVALDLPDQDYVIYVLGRDAKGKFRCVWWQVSIATQEEAAALLDRKLAEFAQAPPEEFHQGDEVGRPVDFFAPQVAEERQHPVFRTLISQRGYSPARAIIGEMMHYFEDADGNFIQQFQSDGFDARLWELYLYALVNELGYGLDREHAAPDFHCQGLLGDFFIEATAVHPSDRVPLVDAANRGAYFEHYVPMKYGSALFSKLRKKYWEQPHVAGHPLVLAVQDFHASQAMIWSNSALVEYLYAIRQIERVNEEGQSEIVSEPVTEYRWGDKPPVPAGFFLQPDSENISAVIANPGGTISKFNRIGFLAGFGDRDIKMLRGGFCYKGSRIPERFVAEVHEPGYEETWCEGLNVYYNPNARIPLPPDSLPCAAHHTSRNGRILSDQPPFHPVGSTTHVIVPT